MTSQEPDISLLVADPNAVALELLVGALNREDNFRVIDRATTAPEVLDAVKSRNPDVVLLTATLAEGPLSGLVALRQIREYSPEVKTVLLVDGAEHNLVVDAFRSGARGVFSLSQSSFSLLCRCVEQVHAGQIWANSKELAKVMEAFSQLAQTRLLNTDRMQLLTNREQDVVRLLAEGLQNRDIARELHLREHTIKNYLFRIFDKLGVSSRVELALYVISNGLRMRVASVPRDERETKALVV